MDIFIIREGTCSGPFTLDQLRTMYGQGQISLRDKAWKPGLDEWTPIKDIPAILDGIIPTVSKAASSAVPSHNPESKQEDATINESFTLSSVGRVVHSLLAYGMIGFGLLWIRSVAKESNGPATVIGSSHWLLLLMICSTGRILLADGYILLHAKTRKANPLKTLYLWILLFSIIFLSATCLGLFLTKFLSGNW